MKTVDIESGVGGEKECAEGAGEEGACGCTRPITSLNKGVDGPYTWVSAPGGGGGSGETGGGSLLDGIAGDAADRDGEKAGGGLDEAMVAADCAGGGLLDNGENALCDDGTLGPIVEGTIVLAKVVSRLGFDVSITEKRDSVQLLRSLSRSWWRDNRGGSAVVRVIGESGGDGEGPRGGVLGRDSGGSENDSCL